MLAAVHALSVALAAILHHRPRRLGPRARHPRRPERQKAATLVDVEARSRLESIRSVIEHEGNALHALDDRRLERVLRSIEELQAEIVIALATLEQPPRNGSAGTGE